MVSGRSLFFADKLDRHVVKIVLDVLFLLPAVGVEVLAEIAVLIQEADADDRNPQVGGGLKVVAGENAKAAGVDRQRFVDAEFGAEICYNWFSCLGIHFVEPCRGGHELVEFFDAAAEAGSGSLRCRPGRRGGPAQPCLKA